MTGGIQMWASAIQPSRLPISTWWPKVVFFLTVNMSSSTVHLPGSPSWQVDGHITLPHHSYQWNPPSSATVGANLNMTMLPAKLKQAGYATYMVGKWHEGFVEPSYLPVNRGFDISTGFLSGGEDHFTQKVGCAVDYWKNNAPDNRNGSYDAFNYRTDLSDIFTKHDPNSYFCTFPYIMYTPHLRHHRTGSTFTLKIQHVKCDTCTKQWSV